MKGSIQHSSALLEAFHFACMIGWNAWVPWQKVLTFKRCRTLMGCRMFAGPATSGRVALRWRYLAEITRSSQLAGDAELEAHRWGKKCAWAGFLLTSAPWNVVRHAAFLLYFPIILLIYWMHRCIIFLMCVLSIYIHVFFNFHPHHFWRAFSKGNPVSNVIWSTLRWLQCLLQRRTSSWEIGGWDRMMFFFFLCLHLRMFNPQCVDGIFVRTSLYPAIKENLWELSLAPLAVACLC